MSLLALFLATGLWQVANSEVRSFENSAARDIAARLEGTDRRVEVRAKVGPEAIFGDIHSVTLRASKFETDGLPLFTEPSRSKRGVLRSLRVEMADFTLRGLHVQSLRATIPDNRFDFALAVGKRQIRLSRSGTGPGEVVVSEKDLEDFIKLKFKEVKEVAVRLDRDKIFVDGRGEFIIFEANFSLVARLEPVDGTKLAVAHARILIDGKPAGDAARDVLLRTLNPVLDLNRDLLLNDAVFVRRLEVGGGLMKAFGDVTIPAAEALKEGN